MQRSAAAQTDPAYMYDAAKQILYMQASLQHLDAALIYCIQSDKLEPARILFCQRLKLVTFRKVSGGRDNNSVSVVDDLPSKLQA